MSVVLVVVIYTYYSSVVSSNKLANLVRIPVDRISSALTRNYDLFAFLSFLTAYVVV